MLFHVVQHEPAQSRLETGPLATVQARWPAGGCRHTAVSAASREALEQWLADQIGSEGAEVLSEPIPVDESRSHGDDDHLPASLMWLFAGLMVSALLTLRYLGIDTRPRHGVGKGQMEWQVWAGLTLTAAMLLGWTAVDLWYWRRKRRAGGGRAESTDSTRSTR